MRCPGSRSAITVGVPGDGMATGWGVWSSGAQGMQLLRIVLLGQVKFGLGCALAGVCRGALCEGLGVGIQLSLGDCCGPGLQLYSCGVSRPCQLWCWGCIRFCLLGTGRDPLAGI